MKNLLLLCLCWAVSVTGTLKASDSGDFDDSGGETEVQPSRGILLPAWENGEFYESFDVRIWPEAVVLWLEQENLRDLIADPATPEGERKKLKRILAMQQAWRTT